MSSFFPPGELALFFLQTNTTIKKGKKKHKTRHDTRFSAQTELAAVLLSQGSCDIANGMKHKQKGPEEVFLCFTKECSSIPWLKKQTTRKKKNHPHRKEHANTRYYCLPLGFLFLHYLYHSSCKRCGERACCGLQDCSPASFQRSIAARLASLRYSLALSRISRGCASRAKLT